MLRCRVGDVVSGPGDPRMSAYFSGEHHPREALRARIGYIADSDGKVAGYIGGHLTRRYGCDGEVQYLYVVPEMRRTGIAAKLLRLMAEWFRTQDASRICVNADVTSAAAVAFYEKQGAVALSKHWYVWKDIHTSL